MDSSGSPARRRLPSTAWSSSTRISARSTAAPRTKAGGWASTASGTAAAWPASGKRGGRRARAGRPGVKLDRLRVSDLDYELPELIAQTPAEPRDAPPGCSSITGTRRRGPARLEDRRFAELPSLLRAGDLLVRNDTRVLAARVALPATHGRPAGAALPAGTGLGQRRRLRVDGGRRGPPRRAASA